MMDHFHELSQQCSKAATEKYSTSFSSAIKLLHPDLRIPVFNIYGFVRFADEIVDTFHQYNKTELLAEFKKDTYNAIKRGISMNPILHSFQLTVNKYQVSHDLIAAFFKSMEMDLSKATYNSKEYKDYIYGSAEVVGLMCLHVFTMHNPTQFEKLKPFAAKLGSAFQKVNFMRDLHADVNGLGRRYFPELRNGELSADGKKKIESEVQSEFDEGYKGIRQLPRTCRLGVYVAYLYYMVLFRKIRGMSPEGVLNRRIRIPNPTKLSLLCYSYVRHQLNLI